MKILQIHNFYKVPGGESTVVDAEKTLLQRSGHLVLRFTADSREIDGYSLAKKAAVLLQVPYNIGAARALHTRLKHTSPDIAHVHNVFPLLSPSIYVALRHCNVPVVQTVHNFRFLCPNGLFFIDGKVCEDCVTKGMWSAVRKRCMHNSAAISALYATSIGFARRSGNLARNIDRFIALNRFTADKLAVAGIPSEKIRICSNFVETTRSTLSDKGDYILYLGRLSPEKGLRTLLDAMKLARSARLIVAGTGPIESELREYALANALTNVEFVGFVQGEAKERLLREAISMVLPSECYENFPLSVLESFAAGTPVIASRIGGLPDIVEHEQNGLVFTPGDSNELSCCIDRLINNKEQAMELAGRALQSAQRRFGSETHYRGLLSIYAEACGTKS